MIAIIVIVIVIRIIIVITIIKVIITVISDGCRGDSTSVRQRIIANGP